MHFVFMGCHSYTFISRIQVIFNKNQHKDRAVLHFRCIDNKTPIVTMSLYLSFIRVSCLLVQASRVCLTWSETPKAGFFVTRLIFIMLLHTVFGVGFTCRILYSFVGYLYVSCSGSITSVGEERANLSAIVYL